MCAPPHPEEPHHARSSRLPPSREDVVTGGVEIALDIAPDLPQLHGDRKPNGMGIGLAICSTFVEAHGGRLCARNRAERGSLFEISLPALEGAP